MISFEQEIIRRKNIIGEVENKYAKIKSLEDEIHAIEASIKDIDVEKLKQEVVILEGFVANACPVEDPVYNSESESKEDVVKEVIGESPVKEPAEKPVEIPVEAVAENTVEVPHEEVVVENITTTTTHARPIIKIDPMFGSRDDLLL